MLAAVVYSPPDYARPKNHRQLLLLSRKKQRHLCISDGLNRYKIVKYPLTWRGSMNIELEATNVRMLAWWGYKD